MSKTTVTQQANTASFLLPDQGVLQRKCACGNQTVGGGECAECGKKKRGLQRKLTIGASNDPLEREADRVADQVMAMPTNSNIAKVPPRIQRFIGQSAGSSQITAPASVDRVLASSGRPLESALRQDMEQRFGRDFSQVRVHSGTVAKQSAREVNANAYTVGNNIVFGADQLAPRIQEGRRLIVHELTHVVQQLGAKGAHASQNSGEHRLYLGTHASVSVIQRETHALEVQNNVAGPLTDREWELVELWFNNGEVGSDPLTENARNNAVTIAAAIFCGRTLTWLLSDNTGEDPLLCVMSSVTRADPRVEQLVAHVEARGSIINWTRVDPDQRMLHVMRLLINTHGYPVNGAAGLVGNLSAESGVLPNRIEGSARETPMRARNARGRVTDFSAEQVMNRNTHLRQGPRRPGVGLAQWTSANRRSNLFQHQFGGRQVGSAILFNMDAQIDYLVAELQANFLRVNRVLMRTGVSVNDASDEVVLNFETPAAVIEGGRRLPRVDPRVQAVFRRRRNRAQRALRVFDQARVAP